jgi:rare lipoprotein A (peptidoglycan hydrolase)
MKREIFIILLLINVIYFHAEKWVGRAATYQLADNQSTSSGDTFNRSKLTAACNGFRLGSKVSIMNVNNGKKIEVIINDRIKDNHDYFILLSPKAAAELDMQWETGLIIVDANFSDVNSTERLAVNGLVKEDEMDEELVNKFPNILWPEQGKEKDNNIDELYQKDFPEEEEKISKPEEYKISNKMDTDENDQFMKREEKSLKQPISDEPLILPEKIMDEYKMDEDIFLSMLIREKEEKSKEKKIKVEWEKSLAKGKIFIRFSTTFNLNEGERRYRLFQQIYDKIVGMKKGNKYILYIGPVSDTEVDKIFNIIRSYGFKDAYIVKG